MLQHGPSGLRARASESAIELIDAQGMRALVASEDHVIVISWRPVDCVHQPENTYFLFLPRVISITFQLPWFEKGWVLSPRGCSVLHLPQLVYYGVSSAVVKEKSPRTFPRC